MKNEEIMSSIYDMYLKDNIMAKCETYFNQHLKEQNAENENLTEEDREMVKKQIDSLLAMIVDIYTNNKVEENALAEIVDKLIGVCIVGKMNEARLCRLLNEKGK
jgi:hypothetical protein